MTVDCAADEALIGGGFGADDINERSYICVPNIIHRAGPGKLDVKFTMLFRDPNSAWKNTVTIKAWAICTNSIERQSGPTTAAQTEIAASTVGCVLAECPVGSVILGG